MQRESQKTIQTATSSQVKVFTSSFVLTFLFPVDFTAKRRHSLAGRGRDCRVLVKRLTVTVSQTPLFSEIITFVCCGTRIWSGTVEVDLWINSGQIRFTRNIWKRNVDFFFRKTSYFDGCK